MKLTYLSSILILFFSIILYPQQETDVKSIQGVVLDSESKNPLAGVTIIVLERENEKLLTGTSSNEKGEFELKTSLKENQFILKFSYIGYSPRQIDSFEVKEQKINLGVMYLNPSTLLTSTAIVQGQKPMVEFYIDKQVINMDKVPGYTSGSVSEVLKNTGIIEVDPGTNKISVRGNSNVNILIDGKPQPMADNLLSQMPATFIDKVEVITTPSAKDDPEGDAGTINIITRKEKRDNMNGTVSLYSSTQGFGFGSFVLNYRKNNFNVFASGNSYFGEFSRRTFGERVNYFSNSLHSQLSEGSHVMRGFMAGFKLGFDYDIDTLNSFSFTGNYNKTNGKMITSSDNQIFNINNDPTYDYGVNDDGKGDFNNYTLTTNYRKKFNTKGHEISADVFYSNMVNALSNLLTTDFSYNPLFPALQKGVNDVKNQTIILNSDYVNPSEDLGKLESGYKFTFRDRTTILENSNYSYLTGIYFDSLGLSNTFKYKESINALYFTYTNKISILEYKLGMRYEHTFTDANQLATGEFFTTDYSSLFPSAGIAYKLNELFQVSLNASRKINRPQMELINPFIRINGPNAITRGNPNLQPTFTNSIELKFNPLLNIFYNDAKGRPSQISTNINDSVTVNTTINSGKGKNYGFELTIPVINEPRFPIKLPDWFTMFNLRISYNKLIEEGAYLSEIYSINRDSWRLNGNLSLKPIANITTMLYFNYSPRNEDIRYRNASTFFVGMMISKDFFDKKLQLSLNFNDLFKTVKPVNETFGSNFYNYNRTEIVRNQSIGLSIRYNFNDFSNRKEKEVDDGRDKSGDIFRN